MLTRKGVLPGAVTMVTMMIGTAQADPIEGNWRTEAGSTAAISARGSAYCITLNTGSHAGKRIGTLSPMAAANFPARSPIRTTTRPIPAGRCSPEGR